MLGAANATLANLSTQAEARKQALEQQQRLLSQAKERQRQKVINQEKKATKKQEKERQLLTFTSSSSFPVIFKPPIIIHPSLLSPIIVRGKSMTTYSPCSSWTPFSKKI